MIKNLYYLCSLGTWKGGKNRTKLRIKPILLPEIHSEFDDKCQFLGRMKFEKVFI